MRISRRFLPATQFLTALEALARTGSFTVAAEELHLTQSAVSRQIRTLEGQLGFALFIREKQTVRLTEAGAKYAQLSTLIKWKPVQLQLFLGQALHYCRAFCFKKEIDNGSLVTVCTEELQSKLTYHAVWPIHKHDHEQR